MLKLATPQVTQQMVDAETASGHTAAEIAVKKKQPEILKLLLEHGASDVYVARALTSAEEW